MSIASRITSIEGHLEDAYLGLTNIGADLTGIDKNIDNIADVLDDIYDDLPKVTGEGTNITLDNTRIGKLSTTLKGNTSQTGTPTPTSPIPVNVVSGDNELIVTSKNLLNQDYYKNATYDTNIYKYTQTNIVGGRKLYFKAQLKEGKTSISGFYFCLSDKGNPNTSGATYCWSVNNGTIVDNSSVYTKNYATFPNNDSLYISFYPTTTSVSDIFETYNLLVSENDIDYEPYTGATYPINLPVENLLPNINETNTISGVTFTKNANGTINVNGTANARIVFPISNSSVSQNLTLPKGVYKYTCTPNGGSLSTYYSQVWVGTSYITDTGSGANINISEDKNYVAYIVIENGTTISNQVFKPMLQTGTKANTYTPYGTTPIELCKIGTYQDYFYKSSGKWYLHKEVGKVVLNGNETWGTSGNVYYTSISSKRNIGVSSSDGLISNYFKNTTASQSASVGLYEMFEFWNPNAVNRNVGFNYDNAVGGTTTFKTWLSSNNVTLYYILATPTSTQITYQPLINQLNAIEKAMSKKGQTNISQVNNDLPFIISASALLDASTYIPQLEAQIEALS